MDHESVGQNQLVERYLLGELAVTERDEFEEHYFECSICARDVRDVAAFTANASAVFAERPAVMIPPVATSSGWRQWFRLPIFAPAMAAIALAAMVGYQNLVTIPGLRQYREPQLLSSTALRPVTRGDDQIVAVHRGDHFVQLVIDVSSPQPFPRYECAVQKAGATILTLQASHVEPGGSLTILLPAEQFSPGSYTLVLSGLPLSSGPAKEIDRYSFVLRTE